MCYTESITITNINKEQNMHNRVDNPTNRWAGDDLEYDAWAAEMNKAADENIAYRKKCEEYQKKQAEKAENKN